MKKMINNTKLFSIIKKLFLWVDFKKVWMRKIYCTKCKMYNKFKSLNYHKLAIKHYFFLVLAKSVKVKMEKSVRNKNQLK